MTQYRKKPIVIEAEKVSDLLYKAKYNWGELPLWFVKAYNDGNLILLPEQIEIITLEGTMMGEREDWIIRGVSGELYPCKPDIFTKTYEAV